MTSIQQHRLGASSAAASTAACASGDPGYEPAAAAAAAVVATAAAACASGDPVYEPAAAAAAAVVATAAAEDDPGYDSDATQVWQDMSKNYVKRNCAGCGASLDGAQGSQNKVMCGGCYIAHYCCLRCQKTHWAGGHKLSCKVMISARKTKERAKRAVHNDVRSGITRMKRARLEAK